METKELARWNARKSVVGSDGGYTPVATGSMRKLLRAEGMRALSGADDGDDKGSCLVFVFALNKRGRSFRIWAGTGATMGKGSVGVLEK